MIVEDLLILGVDVGSVRRKGGFSWSSADTSLHGDDDPSALGNVVAAVLDSGQGSVSRWHSSARCRFRSPARKKVPGKTLDVLGPAKATAHGVQEPERVYLPPD